jgi:hypothetical protein
VTYETVQKYAGFTLRAAEWFAQAPSDSRLTGMVADHLKAEISRLSNADSGR